MRKQLSRWFLLLLVVGACGRSPTEAVVTKPAAAEAETPLELLAEHLSEVTPMLDEDVLSRVAPSVVSLSTPTATGSGVVIHIGARGALVITNAHVVERFHVIEVTFNSGSGLPLMKPGFVVGIASDLDLALIEVGAPQGWTALPLASYASLPPRSALFAAGFPHGPDDLLGGGFPAVTITSGSNLPMDRTDARGLELFLGGVNPGNSGGAAIDLDGRLRGVVAAYYPATELSELIPAEHVRAFIGRVRPDVRLAWDDASPRPTVFARRTRKLPQGPSPSLVVVQSPLGTGVGAVISVQPDFMLVATASWLVGPEGRPFPVLVSNWEGGKLRGAGWAKVLLNEPDEGLAMIRTPRMPGATALTLPTVLPSVQVTQPIFANLVHLSGTTVARQGTLSSVWWDGLSVEALKVDLGVQPADLGGLVFDAEDRLLGLSVVSVGQTNLTTLIPAPRLAAITRGHLRGAWAQLEFDGMGRCAIGMTVQVTDPLGTITKAGLSVSRGELLQPEWREAIPQVGYALATSPVVDGYAMVTAIVSPCTSGTLTVQPFVEGEGFVERSPAYGMNVGERRSELLIRGVSFSGTRAFRLRPTPLPPLPPDWCGAGEWQRCLDDCKVNGSADACFEFGKHVLSTQPLTARDLAVSLTFMTKACRAGVPLACAALRELNPAVESFVPREQAAARCGRGELLNCALLETDPVKERQLCLAGVGLECLRAAEAENDGFMQQLGCDAADAESCLRRSLHEDHEPPRRLTDARRACDLGLPAGCLMVAFLEHTFPGVVEPAIAAAAYARACEGRRCPSRARVSRKDIVVGVGTTLDEELVARAQRVPRSALVLPKEGLAGSDAFADPKLISPGAAQRETVVPAMVSAQGSETWAVERLEMADIGTVQFSLARPELLTPQQVASIKNAAPLTTRCALVWLSYNEPWMRQKPGVFREVKIKHDGPGSADPWKDPKVMKCLGSILNVFTVPEPVVLTMRITKG